jgi:DNA-binding MarR family transcriptional regulator
MGKMAGVMTAPKTPAGQLNEASLHGLLGYQLAQAAITTTAVFEALTQTKANIRPVEFTLLCLIIENPQVSSARLAKALAVTKPNITMWVDRLETRGLLARHESQSDKRATELRVTRTGKILAKRAQQALHEGEAAALWSLSSAEQAMLIELLHRVASCRTAA